MLTLAAECDVQFMATGSPILTTTSAGVSVRGQPVDFKQGDPELVQVTGWRDTRKKHFIFGYQVSLQRTGVECKGAQVWNELDGNTKMSQSVASFRKNLIKYVLLQ